MAKLSFPRIIDKNTRVLILGTLPGDVSLQRGQYYANPRNQFWRLMDLVFDVPFNAPYAKRIECLLATGVGLWDVVKSAERIGSLDVHIQSHRLNPLETLVSELPDLKAIGFNGGKAFKLGRKQISSPTVALIALPSSSPAYTLALDRKVESWVQLRAFTLWSAR